MEHRTRDYVEAAYLLYCGMALTRHEKRKNTAGREVTWFFFDVPQEKEGVLRDFHFSEAKQIADITQNVVIPLTRK